jgi:hypothetical protein
MTDIADEDVSITRGKLKRVRERALEAEKNKLHMDLPRGINNEIEEIIREEIN